MKVERFIKEYANYKKNDYKSNELMKEDYKIKAINKIDRALTLRERGMITVDEAIRTILEAID